MGRSAQRCVGWIASFWFIGALIGISPASAATDALIAAAKQEKEVVWYTVQTMTQLVLPLASAFEAKYGIKVNYVRADSAEVVLRIANEAKGGRVLADVFDGTGTLPPLKRENLVLSWVPDFTRSWPAELTDPQGYWVGSNYLVNTLAINTELVPAAAEPHQWSDLLDPKWRGKMAWGSLPTFSGAGGVVGMLLKDYGEDKGRAYLAALAKQGVVGLPVSARQVLDEVIAGEYAIGINVFNIHAVASAGHGAPVKWLPFSPSLVTVNTVSLMKDAPHPNAAKLFVDFMMSEEGQKIFRDNDYLPTNPAVKPRVPDLIPDGKLFRGVALSQDEIDAGMPGWMKLFGELFH